MKTKTLTSLLASAALAEAVGASVRVVDIRESCRKHLSDIGHVKGVHDIAYENAQARERTQVLMDLANMERALVVGTGDLSEIALGWNTYNGDHMSMYQINASVPKTMVLAPCASWQTSRRERSATCSGVFPPRRSRPNSSLAPPRTTRRRGSDRTNSTTSYSSITWSTALRPRRSANWRRSPLPASIQATWSKKRWPSSSAGSAPRSTSATACRTARKSRSRSLPAPTGVCQATCHDRGRMR